MNKGSCLSLSLPADGDATTQPDTGEKRWRCTGGGRRRACGRRPRGGGWGKGAKRQEAAMGGQVAQRCKQWPRPHAGGATPQAMAVPARGDGWGKGRAGGSTQRARLVDEKAASSNSYTCEPNTQFPNSLKKSI